MGWAFITGEQGAAGSVAWPAGCPHHVPQAPWKAPHALLLGVAWENPHYGRRAVAQWPPDYRALMDSGCVSGGRVGGQGRQDRPPNGGRRWPPDFLLPPLANQEAVVDGAMHTGRLQGVVAVPFGQRRGEHGLRDL